MVVQGSFPRLRPLLVSDTFETARAGRKVSVWMKFARSWARAGITPLEGARDKMLSVNAGAESSLRGESHDLYRRTLAGLFAECASGLVQTGQPADARAMRKLQQRLGEFFDSDHAPRDVQFAAFLVDAMIADAFKNVFGDQIWSEEAEVSRVRLCAGFRSFFERISLAVSRNDGLSQFESFQALIAGYLAEIRTLNELWRREQAERGSS